MWKELAVVYLHSMCVKGYLPGDPIGGYGRWKSTILNMVRNPPRHMAGKSITANSIREIAIYKLKERIRNGNY